MERFDEVYFSEWVDAARQAEENQRNTKDQSFKGFGKSGEEDQDAWEQWFDYVLWVNEGKPEREESSAEPQPNADEEDDDIDAE